MVYTLKDTYIDDIGMTDAYVHNKSYSEVKAGKRAVYDHSPRRKVNQY